MVKLFVLSRLLQSRIEHAGLFSSGSYLPLLVKGKHRNHLFAFARNTGNDWSVTLAPRRIATLIKTFELPVGDEVWGDTSVSLPDGAPVNWRNPLTGETCEAQGKLSLGAICSTVPLGFLLGVSSS